MNSNKRLKSTESTNDLTLFRKQTERSVKQNWRLSLKAVTDANSTGGLGLLSPASAGVGNRSWTINSTADSAGLGLQLVNARKEQTVS